jgi:RNA polymerase sigma-70 factor (ECF subfamily)
MELTANAAERAFLEQRLAEGSRAAGGEPAPG